MDDLSKALHRALFELFCPHGGTVMPLPASEHVSEWLLDTDTYVVVGCPYRLKNGTASPCTKVRWMAVSQAPDPSPRNRRKVVTPAPRFLQLDSVGSCLTAAGVSQGRAVIRLKGAGIAIGEAWHAGQGGGTGPGDVW